MHNTATWKCLDQVVIAHKTR